MGYLDDPFQVPSPQSLCSLDSMPLGLLTLWESEWTQNKAAISLGSSVLPIVFPQLRARDQPHGRPVNNKTVMKAAGVRMLFTAGSPSIR